MSISITFLGAAKTVTGSCYLVETTNTKFLIDCGMFQGPEVEIRNFEPFEFDASTLDFVLLTHTHIDHCGLLPKLARDGFTGSIYTSLHSAQLVPILLLDSAKIQENNYREGKAWAHTGLVDIIYTTRDAEQAISQLKVVDFNKSFEPVPGISATYVKAAHVLGAASIELDILGTKVVFSGDIGRLNHELIGGFDLAHKGEPHNVVMESLYAGEVHPSRPESVGEMFTIVNETLKRGGSVFIPCFAVQRVQELLHDIKFAKESGALAHDVPVWLDSPMAQRVTEIYRAALDHSEDSLFTFPHLNYIRNFRQSSKITKRPGQIVLAGSGMASGGRILHHLAANLGNKKNSVVFVGYQAEATLGRELVEGAKKVEIDGHSVSVKAQIHHLQGFSAHGDTNDYLAWLERYQSSELKRVFLVHAEPERAEKMNEILQEKKLGTPYIPDWKEKIEID